MIGFDRDGVLVGVLGDWEACHPKHYNNQIQMPLIKEVIAKINEPCIVISNQQGVKWGYSSLKSVIEQFKWLQKQVPQVEANFFCPDHGETCWLIRGRWTREFNISSGVFRKPNTGMFELAANQGFKIDKYVGDLSGNPDYAEGRDSDLRFALNCMIEYQDVNDFIAS